MFEGDKKTITYLIIDSKNRIMELECFKGIVLGNGRMREVYGNDQWHSFTKLTHKA
jgi:hypothetical protein